ncbi:TlpA family protein disulfide reductase [Pedobacter panaciterrae]
MPGQTMQITYDPANTPLQGQTERGVRALVYQFVNFKWKASDLEMRPDSGKYKGVVNLDKNSGIAVFKFLAGDSVDNNQDQSYAHLLAAPDGGNSQAVGAYAGWGLLRADRFGHGISGYFKKASITDTAFYYWMNSEITRHPLESSEAVAYPFSQSVMVYQGQSGIPRIKRVIGFLKNKGGEQNLLRARAIYQQVLHQSAAVDSLDAILLETYPRGSVARLKAYRVFEQERELDKKRMLGERFLADFPQSSTNVEFDEMNRVSYLNVYQAVISIAWMKKDYQVLSRYASGLPYPVLINVFYRNIQNLHDRKDVPDEVLYPYAKQLVTRFENFRSETPTEHWQLSSKQWAAQYEDYFAKSVLPTYINILRNTGHENDALTYAQRAEETLKYSRASVNEDYAFLLNKRKESERLREVLLESMKLNQSTPVMLGMIKEDYVRKHKSEDGFDAYLNSLKDEKLTASNASELKSETINVKMPDWKMMDLNGKQVSSASLRGKTVVLDFWATWCVPCKASMPGMKMAVEHFSKDKDVVFYFVDTEERSLTYKQDAAKYILDNKYPFNVLFDNKITGEKTNNEVYQQAIKIFKLSGIPMKLVIDPKGNVRYFKSGYHGSPTALADEMIEMVNFTKKAD